MNFTVIIAVLAVVAAFTLVDLLASFIWSRTGNRKDRGSTLQNLPYRRVISHTVKESDNIETVTLECGHTFSLVRHRMNAYPCPQCAEQLQSQKESQ